MSFDVVGDLGWLAMAMLGAATATATVGEGIVLGLVVAIGIGLVINALADVFDAKPEPVTWVAIVGGYHVVGLVLVGAILGAWSW